MMLRPSTSHIPLAVVVFEYSVDPSYLILTWRTVLSSRETRTVLIARWRLATSHPPLSVTFLSIEKLLTLWPLGDYIRRGRLARNLEIKVGILQFLKFTIYCCTVSGGIIYRVRWSSLCKLTDCDFRVS